MGHYLTLNLAIMCYTIHTNVGVGVSGQPADVTAAAWGRILTESSFVAPSGPGAISHSLLIPLLPHFDPYPLLNCLVYFTIFFSLSYSLYLFSCFFISSHSARILPLRFLAGCRRRRLNLVLVFLC